MIPIHNLLTKYKNIDANWLLIGEESMLKDNDKNTSINYKELAQVRLEIIELKDEKIEQLNNEIRDMKAL